MGKLVERISGNNQWWWMKEGLSLRGRAVNINPAQPWEPTLLHPNNPPPYIPCCQQPSIYHIASNTPPPCRGSSHASVGLRRKEWRNGAFMEIRLSTIFPIRYGNISPLPTPAGHTCPPTQHLFSIFRFSTQFQAVCSTWIWAPFRFVLRLDFHLLILGSGWQPYGGGWQWVDVNPAGCETEILPKD